jgi:serine/threonine protein kinase/predicted negative regulator of RcsB-dependent stress response
MNDPTSPQPETAPLTPNVPRTLPTLGGDGSPKTSGAGDERTPQGGAAVSTVESAATEIAPAIPGYEILGVLGRGGMGVVYKAREVVLDRLVALKVVTAGKLASDEQIARFQSEARAEARLQHPNIVQVHAVGEHEGFPYLSLEYMDGGSLAQKIARQPQPPRQAAQFVYLLARAMAYAHGRGIIHRDLKPGNVLLKEDITTENTENTEKNKDTKDNKGLEEKQEKRANTGNKISSLSSFREFREFRGEFFLPKIADFGLAKCLEEDSGYTRTGNPMGTPSYMSPEQAEGRKDIGPAADIWALGVILYEMLVGRTPFSGVTMFDTLEQVRTREPVPPTQLQPKVPIDLETICLKCLLKEPSQRYATAEELGDDLRRFLDGDPIRARPIGSFARLLRWCRRNPRMAGLSAAVLVLLLTVAIVSTVFVFVLDTRRRELESAWQQAREQETIARQQEQRADDKAREAQARYQLLQEALFVVIDKVQRDLQAVPSTAQARRDILEAAIRVLQKNLSQGRDSSRLPDRALASAHMLTGNILREQNKSKEAIEHYNQSLAILEALYRANPDNDLAAGNYAAALSVQGDLALQLRNDAAEAEKLYRQALALQEKSLAQRPVHPDLTEAEIRRCIANSYQRLGEILLRAHPRDVTESRKHFEKAREYLELALPDENTLGNHLRMEQICHRLGDMNERLDRPEAARRSYERCLAERKKLAADFPSDLHRQMEMLRMYGKIGDLYLFAGQTDRARGYYDEAITANESLAKRDNSPGPRMILSLNYYRLATAHLRLHEKGLADQYYRKCLDLRLSLQKQHPKDLGLQIDVMYAQGRCGLHREAADMARQLRERFPKDPPKLLHAASGYSLCAFGVGAGKPEDALTTEERQLRQDYCARAVEALQQAKKNGYKDVKNLQVEPDLEPIRTDKEFQLLLREFAVPATHPE